MPLIAQLGSAGTVAVFGGMVRDFAIGGVGAFKSDIDLVVGTSDPEHLAWIVRSTAHTENQFGGWRIRLDHWLLDVWPVESTWAFKEGFVSEHNLSSLPLTTFFNWDGAVFEIATGRLHLLEGYLEATTNRVLDINLAPNPNPSGMVVRALKMMRDWDAAAGPKLSSFLMATMEERWTEILGRYGAQQRYQWLHELCLSEIKENLAQHLDNTPLLPFYLYAGQLSIPSLRSARYC
jgi:hypothetical protein